MAEFSNLIIEDFQRSNLTAPVSTADLTISVADASAFPVIAFGSGKHFYVTLVEGDQIEVLEVTDRTDLQLTIAAASSQPFTSGARAETWFTQAAWDEMQAFILALVAGGGASPDDISIELSGGGELQIKASTTGDTGATHPGVRTGHIQDEAVTVAQVADKAITSDKLADTGTSSGAVATANIQDAAVSDVKVATGIDASKIASILSSKLPVDTVPQITFAQIDYDTGTPSGGSDGDIFIEWEDYV